jgi:hypothetical protein
MKNKTEKKYLKTENSSAMNKAKTQLQTYDHEIITDPFGSYTGVPTEDPYDKPIQDADDL